MLQDETVQMQRSGTTSIKQLPCQLQEEDGPALVWIHQPLAASSMAELRALTW